MNPLDAQAMPPHDESAEMCTIASLLLAGDDRKLFHATMALVSREGFFCVDNQVIFDVVNDLNKRGVELDSVTVRAELERRQLLQEIGGSQYLARVLNAVPSHKNGPHYAAIVAELYRQRQLIELGNELLRAAQAPATHGSDDASSLAAKFAAKIMDVSAHGQPHVIETTTDLSSKFLDSYDAGESPMLATGLSELDGEIGGIRKGRFSIIGGRASMGKSMFVRQIAINMAASAVKVGIVAVEEDDEKLTANMLSNLSGIENKRIIQRSLTKNERDTVTQAVARLGQLPLFVVDTAFSISDITGAVHRLVWEHGCEVVMVDHLHLIDAQAGKTATRNEEVSTISRSLKTLFRKLNVAGIATAQLNRGGEGIQGYSRKPILKDLRDSGTLEQDGDLIILLHREDFYKYQEENFRPTHLLEAIIAKNKDGGPAIVPLRFDGAHQRIGDWNGGFPNAHAPTVSYQEDPF